MKKKILIVEDNVDMRMLEREILEEAGYKTLEASRAKEGIAIALEEVPDLILMDVRLPSKKRGIGAAKILRKEEKTKDIPIIFVTAFDLIEGSGEVQSITKCDHILKPFEIEDFVNKVKMWLEKE
ncbi:MAG: response regulator [Candidatus Tantalella remota]|nr:response regulator [Candidatus Tantalella remota]